MHRNTIPFKVAAGYCAVAVVLLVIAFIINISAKLAGRKLKKH